MYGLEWIQARNRKADIDEILVSFAKAGNEADFRWLARSQGLSEEEVEELWRGTCKRVRPGRERRQGSRKKGESS